MDASSSAPCSSPELFPLASLVKGPAAGAEDPDGFVFRIESTWPLVFKMVPETRSKTIVALTPAFLERRPKVSSSASAPALLWGTIRPKNCMLVKGGERTKTESDMVRFDSSGSEICFSRKGKKPSCYLWNGCEWQVAQREVFLQRNATQHAVAGRMRCQSRAHQEVTHIGPEMHWPRWFCHATPLKFQSALASYGFITMPA